MGAIRRVQEPFQRIRWLRQRLPMILSAPAIKTVRF
jgi:hypothetical protein